MRRICILSCYDSEGKIRKYLETYIKALEEVANDLVIVVNEPLTTDGLECLKKYTDKVYIRENSGFDSGAYKYILKKMNYSLSEYDELILTNDTCFGPFIPFYSIFKKMEKKKVDFWGINYIENHILNHLQSNFLVFRKDVFEALMDYFQQKISESTIDINDVYIDFEMGIFNYLVEKNYLFGYYTPVNNVDIYKSPNYCIKVFGYPFMKKKCFEQVNFRKDNCLDALCFINEHYNYEIESIFEVAQEKYNIDLKSEYLEGGEIKPIINKVWVADFAEHDLYDFLGNNQDIYIYGAGIIAKKIFRKYSFMIKQMRGFIVSNKNENVKYLYGKPVFDRKEIFDKKSGILVAMSRKNTLEVRPYLKNYENVFYLFEKT